MNFIRNACCYAVPLRQDVVVFFKPNSPLSSFREEREVIFLCVVFNTLRRSILQFAQSHKVYRASDESDIFRPVGVRQRHNEKTTEV